MPRYFNELTLTEMFEHHDHTYQMSDDHRYYKNGRYQVDIIEDKVIVQYYKESPSWYYPESDKAYKIVELCHSKNLPFSKAFEFSILKNNDNEFWRPIRRK